MIRSFLFAPANVPRRVEKALTLAADAVILDLEDSVAPSDKPGARSSVAEALKQPRKARGYVRVNAPSARSTAWSCRRSKARPTCTRSTG
jgi:citrate lyase subunit beta/citryl-CoA lyase